MMQTKNNQKRREVAKVNNKKKNVKLYNVLFPFWMLLFFPQMWLFVIPGNFIIDSIVLLISMGAFKISERKQFYKKHILKVYGFGMLSDVIGSAFMFLMTFIFHLGTMGDELYLTVPAFMIASIFIFIFNCKITFKDIENPLRRKLSLIFAIATAPYTFLIPSSWIYGF